MNTKKLHSKKALLFLLLAVAGLAKAQNNGFAPIGAKWYYETSGVFSSGYIKMAAEKDTIIDGNVCIKLLREKQWYDSEFDEIHDIALPPVFLSQIGDSVMYYSNERFYKLFDFGANIGDSVLISGMLDFCASNVCKVFIMDKGTEIVKGVSLRYIDIKDAEDSTWGWSGTIVGSGQEIPIIRVYERIGAIGSYFFPEQRCTFDYGEGGILRCYEDDEIGYLNYSYPLVDCDYIEQNTALEENKKIENVQVFPNPCHEAVYVNMGKNTEDKYLVELYDVIGNLVYSDEGNYRPLKINVENYKNGLYILKVKSKENTVCKLLIKK